MKFNVYAVKDIEKGVFLQPFFVPFYEKEENVKLDFGRNLKAAESIISKFPDKFSLVLIGEYFDETGALNPLEIKELCTAADLLEEKKENVGNPQISEDIQRV